ncbi:MAG: hypothetical protein A3E83_09050 [Gammaproteobacteria bacterium RIFCSPHIGHO2_12_FULL_41_20]|nr:MAG: hypothetical protein A3E83_09050 [Gammaproteobacteria bacterium RIFCSPHIGHO2_12_FULL_41_20]
MQPRTSLRTVINEKIDYYLSTDNPYQPGLGLLQRFALYAKKRVGQTGHDRAITYKTSLEAVSDNDLAQAVWDDVCADASGILDTSVKLRLRLLEGLCGHFGIEKEKIDADARDTMRYLTLSGGVPIHTFEQCWINSAKRYLKDYIVATQGQLQQRVPAASLSQ